MPASKPTPIIETPVSGPHELYTALDWDIVYKSTPALATLDDQTFTIVQHAVEKAIVATCIAAHIPATWHEISEQIIAQLPKEQP